jgi:hypothetical protein
MTFAVTIHNITPVAECRGLHVPFHSYINEPFKTPFTFGPKFCGITGSAHVGIPSDDAICGAFIGASGQFLVMSADRFIIITPKDEGPITLGDVMFPKCSTHDMVDAQIGTSYRITVGSSILAYDASSKPSLKSATIFLGNGAPDQEGDAYHNGLPYFSHALTYFVTLTNKFIVHKRELNCITIESNTPSEDGESRPCEDSH